MRTAIWTVITGCLLGHAPLGLGTVATGEGNQFVEPGSCHSHLHALVAHLVETAQLEGRTLVVEWHSDGSVALHCPDFTQRVRCQGGTLHIHFGDALRQAPED